MRPTVPSSSSKCTIRTTDSAKLGSASFSLATRMSPMEMCSSDLYCAWPTKESAIAKPPRVLIVPHIPTILGEAFIIPVPAASQLGNGVEPFRPAGLRGLEAAAQFGLCREADLA